MRNFLLVLLSIALTAICWGVYGPVLHLGKQSMANDTGLRPFICVGVAYFLIAVLAPALVLRIKGEVGHWTAAGTLWSLAAGVAGALGALGIILAFVFRGNPVFVMPLVFGCAPVVNTFYTMAMTKTYKQAGPLFYAGLILVVAGAVTVLVFKPTPHGAHGHAAASATAADSSAAAEKDAAPTDTAPTNAAPTVETPAAAAVAKPTMTGSEIGLVTLCVAVTALSWGVYGPVLHKGQSLMAGSRLRPLVCVGLSYFVIAVLVPSLILGVIPQAGQFTFSGTLWSLAGGAAGAVGALGIILAFNFGGKPIYVMPLVFGGAPVINTFATLLFATTISKATIGEIHPVFYAGLITVVAGAVSVLIFAPKTGHKPAAATAETGDGSPALGH